MIFATDEIIVALIYSIIFIGFGYFLENRMTSSQTRTYFLPGLALKIIGGLCVGLVYYLYYKGGDTVTYYTYGAQRVTNAFNVSPEIGLELIFGDNEMTPKLIPYAAGIKVFKDDASYYCVRFAAFFNLFSFNTYSGTVIWMAFSSYICIWRLYQLMVDLYPDMHKRFAIGMLFLPSVFFWGSGILKDTITFAFLCLLIHSAFRIFFFRKNIVINSLIVFIAGYFIAAIKIYILIAVVPAFAFLFLFGPVKNIQNPLVKMALTPILIGLSVVLGFISIQKIGGINDKYSVDKMVQTAESTARWIHYSSEIEGGSSYSLGDYDFSTFGVVKKTIPAIVVSLFRPFPWEARNPIMILAALEALFFVWLFYDGFLKNTFLNRKARSSSIIITFFLIFVLIFSWAVGLTTYNFGTLVRYKIPMMPFFVIAMYMMKRNKELLISENE